jgi:ABC-type transport system involved in cytochrome c biogenesis permease subunit
MSVQETRPETRRDTPSDEAEREREARDVEAIERRETARPVHPIAAARDRFGGIDLPASLVGMLTAIAMLVLLGGVVGAAVGAIGYQTGLRGDNVEDISIASLIGGLVVIAIAYLVGGWTAGRIARYDGARNGLMTGVWTIVLAGALSALATWFGSEYDVFANVDLPQWFDRDALTTAALLSGAAAVATMLVAGVLGGLWGVRYHRLADQTILEAQELHEVDV